MKFENRIVLLTGGTGALGVVVTQAFLKQGAQVVTTYHGANSLVELQNAVGEDKTRLHGIATDVTNEASVQALVAQIVSQFSRLDVLVNLVGGYAGGTPVAETTEAHWDRMLTLNLKSAFLACKSVLPQMFKQNYGRIINTSSLGALHAGAGEAAYAVSKAGVLTLTQGLAQEVKQHNLTANVVLPGLIDTPQNRKAIPHADYSKWIAPASIANVMLFLASEEASAINGAVVPIPGKG